MKKNFNNITFYLLLILNIPIYYFISTKSIALLSQQNFIFSGGFKFAYFASVFIGYLYAVLVVSSWSVDSDIKKET